MPVIIRKATVQDVPVILDLVRGLAEYERAAPGQVTATEESLRASLFGGQPSAEALLAWVDQQPVGFAVFFHNYSTWHARRGLYLEDLFVKEEARGRGIGKALLRELAAIAKERGCARMEWMVLDWNAPAIAFYRSLGAAPLEEWTVFRVGGQALADLAAGQDLASLGHQKE